MEEPTFAFDEYQQYTRDLASKCEEDAGACYDLGKFYLVGVGSKSQPNITQAKKFLTLGCQKQSGKSCCLLAGLYREEKNTREAKKHWSEAQRLLTRDCEIESKPNACMFWGLELLSNSKDPVRDYPVALRFLERGCKLGQPVCCLNAGVVYSNYVKDSEKAKRLFEKACSLGNGDACWLFGEELDKTNTATKELNPTALYKEACDKNCLEGCVAHGTDMIKEGKFDLALESLTTACNQGESNGCILGGLLLLQTKNNSHALQLFNKGCEIGNDECCLYAKKAAKE